LKTNRPAALRVSNLRDAKRLGGHLAWRLGRRPAFASAEMLEDLASTAAAPARLAYLLAYERATGLRSRLRGAPRWKSTRKQR
jgi:uncharacterized protein YciW